MTALSTGALSQSLITSEDMFIPFVALMKIDFPFGYGKRRERMNEIEKLANIAEADLNAFLVANGYTTDASNPIKFTIAYGNFVARFTINGNVKRPKGDIPKSSTLAVTVLNTGNGVVGYGCTNSANKVADPYIVSFATELKDSLETIIPHATVLSLDVAGIKFGDRGRTF
jgi:hypothetical protein